MASNTSIESASATGSRRDSIAQSSFVGRSREVAILHDAVSDTLAGRGRLMMLSGEPGIGKTRLAEETVNHAKAHGAQVRWGRCWEDGGAPAFWPWIQVIRESMREKDETGRKLAQMGSGLSYIARMVPELQSVFAVQEPLREDDSGIRPEPWIGPTAERFRLFDAIASLFKVLVATVPMAIVFDDLHAADEDSLMLLRFISRELKQLRILIIATFREVEARQSAPLRDLLSDIGREGSLIPLRGLDPGDVADFIRNNAPVVDAELASSLHQATEGNPFFLDEIVRLIIAEREPGASTRQGHRFSIPDSVRSAVNRRVAPLSEGTRSILTIASVIGKEFELAVLREVSELPAEQILGSLEEALAHAVIIAQKDAVGHYRFSHAIISETLHTGLGASARAQLHQRIASALEQVYGVEPGPHLARLAHHQVQALPLGDRDKAFEYARRGAEHARNQLAFGETVRLYRLALEALAATPKPKEPLRCEVLLAMGEALAQGANLGEARQAFEEAADTARRGGHTELVAESALHLSGWFDTFLTVDRPLLALLEEGLHAVGETHLAQRASLMAKLASARYWAGDRAGGLALSDQAVELARSLNDPRTLTSALWDSNQLRWGPEDVEGRLASATEIAALAESIGDYQRALRAHEMRFTALLEMGDIPAVEAEVMAYETLAKKAGEQFGIVERFRAALALLRGDFQEADLQIRELLALAERRQDPALVICGELLAGILREERGRLDPVSIRKAAEAKLERSPALAASNRAIFALGEALLGRRAEAVAELESLAKDNFAALYRDWNWLENLRILSLLAVMLRETRYAEAIYNLMLPYADRNITAGWGDVARGSAGLSLGALARMVGRLDDAERHFEQALRFNQRIGAQPSVVRTQFEYGRMLLSRGKPGDCDRALNLLNHALATATALGMEALRIRIRAVLEKAEPPPEKPRVMMPAAGSDEILRKEGDFWTVSFEGKVFRIRHIKGLDYIAYLMRYPDREFHALALVAGADGANVTESMPQAAADPSSNQLRYGPGDAGEMLDEKARAAYREKINRLREALEEAKERGDLERAADAEDEIEALVRELSRATGWGGRVRRASSDVERARLNVQRAIKAAIVKIAENDPALGRLLTKRIRTGTFCCYVSDSRQQERAPAVPATRAIRGGSIEAVAAAAVAEPRVLLAQAAPDGTVTIMFSDVEDSSVLVERLGDIGAHDILKIHNQIVREQVAAHQGFEVKAMGDGFMIAFSSARRALLCAIAVQRALAIYSENRGDRAVRVRIGLHVGETIRQSDDFFGKTVILAARIAGLARGGEILVSSTFRDLTESAGDLRFEPAGEFQLKGLSGKHRLFRAIW